MGDDQGLIRFKNLFHDYPKDLDVFTGNVVPSIISFNDSNSDAVYIAIHRRYNELLNNQEFITRFNNDVCNKVDFIYPDDDSIPQINIINNEFTAKFNVKLHLDNPLNVNIFAVKFKCINTSTHTLQKRVIFINDELDVSSLCNSEESVINSKLRVDQYIDFIEFLCSITFGKVLEKNNDDYYKIIAKTSPMNYSAVINVLVLNRYKLAELKASSSESLKDFNKFGDYLVNLNEINDIGMYTRKSYEQTGVKQILKAIMYDFYSNQGSEFPVDIRVLTCTEYNLTTSSSYVYRFGYNIDFCTDDSGGKYILLTLSHPFFWLLLNNPNKYLDPHDHGKIKDKNLYIQFDDLINESPDIMITSNGMRLLHSETASIIFKDVKHYNIIYPASNKTINTLSKESDLDITFKKVINSDNFNCYYDYFMKNILNIDEVFKVKFDTISNYSNKLDIYNKYFAKNPCRYKTQVEEVVFEIKGYSAEYKTVKINYNLKCTGCTNLLSSYIKKNISDLSLTKILIRRVEFSNHSHLLRFEIKAPYIMAFKKDKNQNLYKKIKLAYLVLCSNTTLAIRDVFINNNFSGTSIHGDAVSIFFPNKLKKHIYLSIDKNNDEFLKEFNPSIHSYDLNAVLSKTNNIDFPNYRTNGITDSLVKNHNLLFLSIPPSIITKYYTLTDEAFSKLTGKMDSEKKKDPEYIASNWDPAILNGRSNYQCWTKKGFLCQDFNDETKNNDNSKPISNDALLSMADNYSRKCGLHKCSFAYRCTFGHIEYDKPNAIFCQFCKSPYESGYAASICCFNPK